MNYRLSCMAAIRRLVSLSLMLLSGAIALFGCGYHVTGHNDSLPKSIRVIAVPALENKTSIFRVEQKLTAATIHEFLAKTRYKIVSDPNGGDAVLTGTILSVEILPLLFQSTSTSAGATAQATAMMIILKCEVTLTERDNDKVLYHTDNFVFRNEYQLAATATATGTPTRSEVESFFQEGDPALDRMSQDFAQSLVAAVTENF